MKKILFFAFVLVVCAVTFTACERNDVDSRDSFIGEYTFNATGDVELYVGSTRLFNVPLDQDGTFIISKAEEEGQVMIVGYNDTIYAAVSGNNLFIESTVTNEEYNGATIKMTFIYGKATLVENRLSWETDVQATATYGVLSGSGTGHISVVATKK